MDKQVREKVYKALVRKQRIAMMFARALAKRRRGLIDSMLAAFAARMAKPAPGSDFMRDPLLDAEPEYTVEELRRFRERRS